jgi:hypothetical protein
MVGAGGRPLVGGRTRDRRLNSPQLLLSSRTHFSPVVPCVAERVSPLYRFERKLARILASYIGNSWRHRDFFCDARGGRLEKTPGHTLDARIQIGREFASVGVFGPW